MARNERGDLDTGQIMQSPLGHNGLFGFHSKSDQRHSKILSEGVMFFEL